VRILEIRRHSYTKAGDAKGRGSDLSADGVRLAREAGSGIGPFAYIAASLIPRSVETAIAMGFAVDDLYDFGGGELWESASREIAHRALRDDRLLYGRYLSAIDQGGAVAVLAHRQVDLWLEILGRVHDGEAALVITHGGLIEPGLVAAIPDWPHDTWGRGFRQCEGARLQHDGERFIELEVLRLDGA
jgi:broad specificity phosphatase PhoE